MEHTDSTSGLFNLPNPSLLKPIFQLNSPITPIAAINIIRKLCARLANLIPDNYAKIPHAISALSFYQNQLRIDTNRKLNNPNEDPYVEEEALLAPPESTEDRYWRRHPQRMTYFISQLFYSLLMGNFPKTSEIPTNFAENISQEIHKTIQNILHKGLAANPKDRFQTIDELYEQIILLEAQLQPTSSRTKIVVSAPQPKKKNTDYEIQIWSSKEQDVNKLVVKTPAKIIIGRKSRQLDEHCDSVGMHMEKEGELHCYRLYVGDRCLSRSHAEINLSAADCFVKDLGSTHGGVIYLDTTCETTSCFNLKGGRKVPFTCPTDQYLQLANTYVRVRPTKSY